ncbi:tetratricopeptide repeat protein [Pontiella sp.]|uniref:tetratricopeptide repeat protein n=1 Tax=Pontiella sp. TaxID=2837462 RepID=UPI003561F0E5
MKRILVSALTLAALVSAPAGAQTQESAGIQINQKTDAERIEFLLSVADAYFAEKEYESAVSAYERILEIDPNHQQSRYVIGHVYIEAKQYQKAEKLLSELVEDFPEDFKLKNNLAWLYATAEDPAVRDGHKAIALAQEAMAIDPYDHHVWSTLAEAYYVTGQYEKAYRAITHMASVATTHGQGVTQEQVDAYNEQIRKCKRAWDTQKMIEGTDDESEK